METVQLGDNSAECSVYIVLLVSERGAFGDNSAECADYIVLLVSERRAFTTLGRR